MATQRMTTEATSKKIKTITANNVLITSKADTWELLNKLLQTAFQKWMHSSRQPEAAIVTYHHTVGKNGLGLNRPCHHYQIVQEVLYQQWFRWHGRWDVVWAEQYDKLDTDSGEEGDDTYDDTWTDTTDVQWRERWWWILGFESILLILVGPIQRFDSGGVGGY